MKISTADISASLVVFLVALPLCLGMALASDAPIASGIIAGVIGGVVVGFWGGSSVSVAGPAAGLAVVVAASIHKLGSFELFSLAVVIAGIIQIVFAILKAYQLTHWIPHSVVKGMLSAIGILICIKETPYLLGTTHTTPPLQYFSSSRFTIIIISIVTLITILLSEKYHRTFKFLKSIPASLLGVIIGSAVASLISSLSPELFSSADFVQIPEMNFYTFFHIPNFNNINFDILQVAIILALIASIETLLCLEASSIIDPLKRPINSQRELIAQGAGNILSGIAGGLPITAVIVRTAANIEAGAKTKLSSVLHGILLLIFVVFFAQLANHIPLASLAVVLAYVGYKLFAPKVILDKKQKGWASFLTFLITIFSILITDILFGVSAGTAFHYIIQFLNKNKA